MWKIVNKNILTGLITLVPVILTFYLLYWFVLTTETFLGNLIRASTSEQFYRPGMGVIAGLIVAFFVGLLMQTFIAQQLLSAIERLLKRLPIVKSVYLSIRDLLDYFSSEKQKEFDQVVAINLGDHGMQVIGLVTQADMANMPKGFDQKDHLLVYIPMSYGIGGFAVLVPRSATRPLNMSMEDAMRFALTAGVTSAAKTEGDVEQ
jgi:uncharacterized membrane protein